MDDERFCSSCGAANPTDAKFCSQCGTALATSPPGGESSLWAREKAADERSESPEQHQEPATNDGVAEQRNRFAGLRKWALVSAAALLLVAAVVVATLGVSGSGEGNGDGAERVADTQAADQSDTVAEGTDESEEDTDGDGTPDSTDADPYSASNGSDDTEFDDAPSADEGDEFSGDTEPEQKVVQVGKSAIDDEITFKVNQLEPVGSIPAGEFSDGPITAKPGAKLVKAVITWKNNMSVPVDIWCGGGPAVLLDEEDRNFQPMDNYTEIAGNETCGEEVQPGFKQTVTLAFQMPQTSKTTALVLWNSEAEEDYDGDQTQILVLK